MRAAFAALFTVAIFSQAHALDVVQTVHVAAAPERVWLAIGDFAAIANWLPPAASSPADHGNDLGSVRVITLKAPGNPTVTEKLTARDPAAHSYSYTITQVDPKVLPVVNYTSTITVAPGGGGSVVVWQGHFAAAAGVADADAEKAVTGVYRAGLDNLPILLKQ